jgi:hypothetical protein
MPPKKIVATHVKDIKWIISLWFAVQGGDRFVWKSRSAHKLAAETSER